MSDDTFLESAEDKFAAQCDEVRKALYFKKTSQAVELIGVLLEQYPESTTIQELYGDVLLQQGKRSAAKEAFKKAMELEPANADAERKFAEATLMVGQSDRTRQLLESGDLHQLRGSINRDASHAMVRSLFFPGLGQLYNGEYEKGIITTIIGLPLFGLALWGLISIVMSAMMPSASPMSDTDMLLGVFGVVGYAVLLIWSAWDAHETARRGDESGPQT